MNKNNHFRNFNNSSNDVNIFHKFSFAASIVHNIAFLRNCNYGEKNQLFKTFVKNANLFVYVVAQFHETFLIFDKNDCVSSQNNVSKTNIKILSNQFDFFHFGYIFYSFNKINNIAKINVLVDMLYKIFDNNEFVIIHWIEEINFFSVLTIFIAGY